jgi:hypothetical protein
VRGFPALRMAGPPTHFSWLTRATAFRLAPAGRNQAGCRRRACRALRRGNLCNEPISRAERQIIHTGFNKFLTNWLGWLHWVDWILAVVPESV